MANIVGVRFKEVGKVYYFDPVNLDVKNDDCVIVETARGIEMGRVVFGTKSVSEEEIIKPLKSIIRIADEHDMEIKKSNEEKQKEAYNICLEKIKKHGLEMKLVDVEYTFDASKILFYFTADGRIDFRDLVKDLANIFRTRIELRQIGVRDETKALGTYGICGQQVCCSRFLGEFEPVSINMAKKQGLSLNPSKISGSCGRLMCCLKYEQSTYDELLKTSPRQGAVVETEDGVGSVEYVNILTGDMKVKIEKEKETVYIECNAKDVKILKNGHYDNDLDDVDPAELKKLEKKD